MTGLFPAPLSFSAIYENELKKIDATISTTGNNLGAVISATFAVNELAKAIVDASGLYNGLKILFDQRAIAKANYEDYTKVYQAAYAKWKDEVKNALAYIKEDLAEISNPFVQVSTPVPVVSPRTGAQWASQITVEIELPLRGILEVDPYPVFSRTISVSPHNPLYVIFTNASFTATDVDIVNAAYASASATLKRYFDVLAREFGVDLETARAIFTPFCETYLFEMFSSLPYSGPIMAGETYKNATGWSWRYVSDPINATRYLFDTAFPAFESVILGGQEQAAYNNSPADDEKILMLEYMRANAPAVFADVMLNDFGIDVAQSRYSALLSSSATSPGVGRPPVVGYSWGDFKRDVKDAYKSIGNAITDALKKLSAIFLPDALESAINRGLRFVRSILPAIAPQFFMATGNFDMVRISYQKHIGHPLQRRFIPDDVYTAAKAFEQKYRPQIKIVGAIVVGIFCIAALAAVQAGLTIGEVFISWIPLGISSPLEYAGIQLLNWKTAALVALDEHARDAVKDAIKDEMGGDTPVTDAPPIIIPSRPASNGGALALAASALIFLR